MADHLGEVYSGVISGVTEWGLYVELDDNKCEGLVPVRDLADDFYDFDEKNYSLVGRRHGHRYRLGDSVQVKVARCDIAKKQLDFVIAGEAVDSYSSVSGKAHSNKKQKQVKGNKQSGKRRK